MKDESTIVVAAPAAVPDTVSLACAIARGEKQVDPTAPGRTITAALQDISARGTVREMWYRMAWDGAGWSYLGDRRLSSDHYRAAGRHDVVKANVYVGKIIAQHDRGGPVKAVYLVAHLETSKRPMVNCPFAMRHDGTLSITLPDSTVIELPNPRKR